MRNNSDGNPYLSLVMCSRNDNHGGNMLRRMQVSISGRLEQLEKHRIESELILVEWNPPAGKPLLKDVIQWPSGLKYCTIRIIEVPSRIHRRYKYHKKLPLAAGIAINTGIRRARGKFVLMSLIDHLYTEELMSFIATKSLKPDEVYRADRCDVNRNVLQYDTSGEQLNFCRQNILRIHSKFSCDGLGLPDLHVSAGDFHLMSRGIFNLLHGYREDDIKGTYCDSLLSYASYMAGVKEVVLNEPMRVYHIDHNNTFIGSFETSNVSFIDWVSLPFIPRSVSFRLISLYSKYVGKITTNKYNGVPVLHWEEFIRISQDIVAGNRSYILNDDTWGLAGEDLKETLVSLAEWDN